MKGKDFLSVTDLGPKAIKRVLDRSLELKLGGPRQGDEPLRGRAVALLFEKPSLRTKVSFDLAVHQLGGHALYLGRDEVGLGTREPIADVARVLSRYVDALVVRTFAQETLETLAWYATVPVINALSDYEHPCQALADLLTIMEIKGRLQGMTIAFIGDGNNVAVSLALASASVGANFHIASPPGYELPQVALALAQGLGQASGARIETLATPREAVKQADVVYTDVWTSMGQEAERERRLAAFQQHQVNPDLLSLAAEGAIFMHPLPAHPGEEIAPGMAEHPQSVVFQQAENRLHAQKGLLAELLV